MQQQVIDEIQEEAKNYNRIYIASIHPELTEEDIKSVFEAFGSIVFCKLAAGSSPASHKGYGFIEYSTNQAALESIASMNLFDLGGQLLRVGRAITPPNALISPAVNSSMPTAAAVAVRINFKFQTFRLLKFFICFVFRLPQQQQKYKQWMQFKQMFSELPRQLWV
jgi:RNA recognition motif-containing protein